ncbi:unnamed protein product [Ambrosiozyma monospora]|uniref:Unnamed protein product n=1 Tax=Ambrosiozyma monospora TaxID=43982 RepID=A0ACB5T804_AMBMO|nr:unnamed protein product [Ambrosiozyma monospora]
MIKEGICKAVSSLRTTLSSNGCQLCKELGQLFGHHLDSFTVEIFLLALMKLCGARKTMSHQNANCGVIGLILHTNFNSRVMGQIISASQEKNTQPRAYASTWLHIILLKYKDHKHTLENALDNIVKLITRGLADATPTVRESMRKTFWCFFEIFPDQANGIKNKLDPSSTKALDRAKPGHIIAPTSQSSSRLSQRGSGRLSMKEMIVAKRRESQQNNAHSKSSYDEVFQRVTSGSYDRSRPSSRPASRSSSRVGSESKSKIGKAIRVGSTGPGSRVASRSFSATSAHRTASTEIKKPGIPKDTRGHSRQVSKELERAKEKENRQFSETDSTLEIMAKVPALNEVEEKLHSEIDEVTERIKNQSHLYELLASSDRSCQIEGFEYIFKHHSEGLSVKFTSVFDRLSISNPSLFHPMFENPEVFKYLVNYIANDNVIRLACNYSLEHPFKDEQFSMVVSEISTNDMCLSLINTLNLVIDTSSLDDLNLSMQFTKYKLPYMRCCFSLISSLIDTSSRIETFLLGMVKYSKDTYLKNKIVPFNLMFVLA